MFEQIRNRLHIGRAHSAGIFVLPMLILIGSLLPQLSAEALYVSADGESAAVLDDMETITEDRIIVTGSCGNSPEAVLSKGEKVTLTHDGETQYATTRNNEKVVELLDRMEISVNPLEMVKVDISEEEVNISIASDFTYYETVTETAKHATIYSSKWDLPKGKTQVTQKGIDGTRDVTYEIIYADGQLVSRQAVAEENNTSVTELAYLGTLVSVTDQSDTIAKVINSGDGSGYLLMASGNSLHFSGRMDVNCTAYTHGYGNVDTVTATGTVVHVGCVAVDKRVIPLGTKMFVSCKNYSYGMAVAEDTGVRGNTVDVYLPTYDQCISFGRRSGTVYFID